MQRLSSVVLLACFAAARHLSAGVAPGGGQPAAPTPTPPPGGGQTTPPPGGGEGSPWTLFLPLILIFAFMYFVLLRPQRKEQKKRQAMIDELRVGERVVTIGGMHGTVKRKGEKDVDLEVSDGVVMTFNVGAVHERLAEGRQG